MNGGGWPGMADEADHQARLAKRQREEARRQREEATMADYEVAKQQAVESKLATYRTPEDTQTPNLVGETIKLADIIGVLVQRTHKLAEQLEPVLVPSKPHPDMALATSGQHAPMVAALVEQQQRLESVIEQLTGLSDRLAVGHP